MAEAVLTNVPPPTPPPKPQLVLTLDWDDAVLLTLAAWNGGRTAKWLDNIDRERSEGLYYVLPSELRHAATQHPDYWTSTEEDA